ncbi:MAG TPA: malectin domain-containing carbohydrate-binding protein [Pyrinomonadaceae bacterium]|jgi:hypothetical protein|nr:malectin domain-containing carbohydrate-binding protein [Pyrinomonadaceae bacterium]
MATKRSRPDGRRGFYSWRVAALTLVLAAVGTLVNSVRLRAVRAASIQVAAGGDFQAALNAAQPGDTIVLAAGATFVGPFTLPYRVGTGTDADWITIRTSAPDSALPPAGQRITPAYSSVLPKLVSPGANQSALYTQPRAHHYRFVGVEFSPINSAAVVDTLVNLGSEGAQQDTLDEVPHHLVLDRCYVYAFPSQALKRGVRLNSAHTDILNSYLAGFKLVGQDSQAVMGSNGPGPFRIVNNYLEGAGENLMFGGADPTVPNLVPSDIEIRNNHFFKPLSWRVGDPSYAGTHWSVKNLLELKNAQRVVIEGNVLENSWGDAQVGYAVLFTGRSQDGGAPWSVVQDVQFTKNVVRHAAAAVQLLGLDYIYPGQQEKRITIANNLFDDIDGGKWGGSGHFLTISRGVADLTVSHNTIFHTGSVIQVGEFQNTGFVFNDNIAQHNQYGVKGDGQSSGNTTLAAYFPNATFRRNLIAGANAANYPADNFYPPASSFDSQFFNRAGGDYHLAATSPGYRAGTDGKDVGADIDALNVATAGVVGGTPPPAAAQTPFSGTASVLPGTIQAEDFDNGGEGVAYHDTTAGNAAGQYRSTDVDIEATGDATGAYNLSWAVAGEWLEYTVNVASAGTYTVEARVASQVSGGTFHVEFDGLDKTGAMTVPNTGGWQTYQTVTKTVSLPAGQHVMRLALDANGATLPDGASFVGNINYLKFTAATPPPSNPPFALRLNAGAAQYVGEGCQTWQADNYYQNGSTYYASNLSTADILNTFDDELYRGERYGGAPGTAPLAYAIPVPNDTYRVRLHFAEVWHGVSNTSGAGARVFDVSVENQLALDDFDIYAAAGGAQRAVVREIQTTVTDGVLNVSFAASVDNAKVSAIEVFNGSPPAANAPFKEQGGQVVVDAESSHASIVRGGKQWAVYRNGSRPAGSVCGGAMVSEPDSGVQIDAGYATTAPERQYQIQFTTPGTYYVWLRAWAANTNNNSVNVGLDGQPTTTSDRISIGTFNAWTWVQGTMDGPVATLVVPTAGQHTVNVWMREDGMWIDRMLLTTSSGFVPSGLGPPESSR